MRAKGSTRENSIGRLLCPCSVLLLTTLCACQGAGEAAVDEGPAQAAGTTASPTNVATAPSAAQPAATASSSTPAAVSGVPASAAPASDPPTTPASAMPGAAAATPSPSTTSTAMTPPAGAAVDDTKPPEGTPTLFWLDIGGQRVYRSGVDGSGAHAIGMGDAPDGIAVDVAGAHVYWSNMGTTGPANNKASVQRTGLDGGDIETLIKPGSGINTAKQMTIDHANQKLYIADREGAKIWRAEMDGTKLEPLISDHGLVELVGIAVDSPAKMFYFSDRNGKKLYRASTEMPEGQTAANRSDLELLFEDKTANAMPLDIDLDLEHRLMYWTDRQRNVVQRMNMDPPAGKDATTRDDVKVLAMNLSSAIGITIDKWTGLGYVTAGGVVSSFKLEDGSDVKKLAQPGSTGITIARIPASP